MPSHTPGTRCHSAPRREANGLGACGGGWPQAAPGSPLRSALRLPAPSVRLHARSVAQYQERAGATRKATTRLTGQDLPSAIPGLAYLAMGLASEAGEVSGEIKKLFRDQPELVEELKSQGSAEAVRKLAALSEEIGDCLWYLGQLASDLGLDLGSIAKGNLKKLAERYAGAGPNIIQFPAKTGPKRDETALKPPPEAISPSILVRVIRGLWTGEGSDAEVQAVEAAVTAVEDWGDGSAGFFLHLGAAVRVLVSLAVIREKGESDGVSQGFKMQHMQPTRARARAREPLAGQILALLDSLQDGDGLTVATAAERLRVTELQVANACWEHGLQLANLPDPSERLAPLMRKGVSFAALWARSGGMTQAAIRAVCARAGWEVPD